MHIIIKSNHFYCHIIKDNESVFLTLHACQPVVGDSQNQNMNLSLPIIGAI